MYRFNICLILFWIGCGQKHNISQINLKTEKKKEIFISDGSLFILNKFSDTIQLEVAFADNPRKKEIGLMYRHHIEPTQGMLFFMEQERIQSFWMKNTYISLDLIFINTDSVIVGILEKAEPLSTQSLSVDEKSLFVLEVKGGLCAEKKIQKGDKVYWISHPKK